MAETVYCDLENRAVPFCPAYANRIIASGELRIDGVTINGVKITAPLQAIFGLPFPDFGPTCNHCVMFTSYQKLLESTRKVYGLPSE